MPICVPGANFISFDGSAAAYCMSMPDHNGGRKLNPVKNCRMGGIGLLDSAK